MGEVIDRDTPTNPCIYGRISATGQKLTAVINPTIYGKSEEFVGDYDITPQAEAQTLNTKNKRMSDDLTVEAIPYYETSNEYGITVNIGG